MTSRKKEQRQISAVRVYSQIPEPTSLPLRFRKETHGGRKEAYRPHQRPEETVLPPDAHRKQSMCVVHSSY